MKQPDTHHVAEAGPAATVAVTFLPEGKTVQVATGTSLLDAATTAGIEIAAPCGGQGRCGRCRVTVRGAGVERRESAHLRADEVDSGVAIACQTLVTGDVEVDVPPPRAMHLVRSETVAAGPSTLPTSCDWEGNPALRTFELTIPPPTLADNTSDLDRLRRELARRYAIDDAAIDLDVLQTLGRVLRASDWHVGVVVEMANHYNVPPAPPRIVAVAPHDTATGTFGLAVDVGTTSVVVYLIDFTTAKVVATASAYNGQIACGEDVISRIVYSQREGGLRRLQELVVQTINDLVAETCTAAGADRVDIYEVVASGNTTMTHLLLGLDPKYLREEPYIPTVSFPSQIWASEVGLDVNPMAGVRCMPAVGSYVGGDIAAGVLSSGLYATDKLTLFIDVGTNGEIVLGTREWMISCACSAGPAFEGGGVACGMRATTGAIEDVWINPETYEPTVQTIEDAAPVGICGSGLIDALGELFVTGVVDKSGRVDTTLPTPRVRRNGRGAEYVLVWAAETGHGDDIILTETDIDNLLRAKAAIYAGFSVLCESVGVELADVHEILIGGAFGQYLDPAKAIEIGLLPDLPVERIHFVGNTSALGAYTTLMCTNMRLVVIEVAGMMTYLELSADNRFMDKYTSALFLPHTDLDAFPSVRATLEKTQAARAERRAQGDGDEASDSEGTTP